MRIIYVAKHDSGGNDDEGAIYHALTSLGHDVQRCREDVGHRAHHLQPADLLLFHKWDDVATLRKFRCPRAFWYFDLVDFPDPTLAERCERRKDWFARILPHCDVGFCTDGDWVAADRTGKLRWLTQGADGRVVGRGAPQVRNPGYPSQPPILMTGIRNGGTGRASFVDFMRETYGEQFQLVQRGVHGRAMADLIAGAKIVVAPDAPVTDHYWSNRVYNALGFGAFLLHPRCNVTEQYPMLTVYDDREHLKRVIDHWLGRDDVRLVISSLCYQCTIENHLYLHRCQRLLELLK